MLFSRKSFMDDNLTPWWSRTSTYWVLLRLLNWLTPYTMTMIAVSVTSVSEASCCVSGFKECLVFLGNGDSNSVASYDGFMLLGMHRPILYIQYMYYSPWLVKNWEQI